MQYLVLSSKKVQYNVLNKIIKGFGKHIVQIFLKTQFTQLIASLFLQSKFLETSSSSLLFPNYPVHQFYSTFN